MQYETEFPEELWDQIHALPKEANEPLAKAMILLGHDPWHGTPYHPDNPDGDVRQLVYGFGHGLIVYLILETQKRVVVERVLWLEALG